MLSFLKNIKIELLYDPAIPFLGMCPEKMKTLTEKDTCTPMFISNAIHNSQDMEVT